MSFPDDNQPTLPHFPQEPAQPLGGPRQRSRASRPVVAGLMVAIVSALVGAAIAHLAWSGPASSSHTPASTTTPGTFGPFSGNVPSQGGGSSANGGTGGGSASSSSSSSSVSAVASRVDSGLVDVDTVLAGNAGEAAGTGQVVTSNGEVITNNHVISGASTITATDLGNGRTYTARVVGYDEAQDVAVIQLESASGLKTVSLGNSDSVQVGQSIITIGNAGGVGGTPSAVAGTVTALRHSITATDEVDGSSESLTGLIEINGGLEPGDSGGPLVNTSGQVLGMDTAASSNGSFSFQNSSDEGFAIPINRVLAIARQIVAGDTSNTLLHLGATPLIGVDVEAAPQTGYGYGFYGGSGSTVKGAWVEEVVPGSSAAAAGITNGSTITGLAGHKVTSPASLVTIKNRYHPGARVSISWVDANGHSHTGTVTFTSGPPD